MVSIRQVIIKFEKYCISADKKIPRQSRNKILHTIRNNFIFILKSFLIQYCNLFLSENDNKCPFWNTVYFSSIPMIRVCICLLVYVHGMLYALTLSSHHQRSQISSLKTELWWDSHRIGLPERNIFKGGKNQSSFWRFVKST